MERKDVGEKTNMSLLLSPVIHLLGHISKRCGPGLEQVVHPEAAAASCHRLQAGGDGATGRRLGAPEAVVFPAPPLSAPPNSLLLFQVELLFAQGPSMACLQQHLLWVYKMDRGRLWLRE